MSGKHLNRRGLLASGLGGGVALCFGAPALALEGAELAPTPSCGADEEPTRRQTEGPYFTPRSPRKADFTGDGRGETILLVGYVLTRDCRPVAQALVDLWHADAGGAYDNAGYRFRGHQFTDERGRYRFRTIVPGLYPGRTRHYHVKIQAPGGPVLTTQFYFPDEPANQRDRIFHPALRMRVAGQGDGRTARYDVVLAG